jgi:hypothetical protein
VDILKFSLTIHWRGKKKGSKNKGRDIRLRKTLLKMIRNKRCISKNNNRIMDRSKCRKLTLLREHHLTMGIITRIGKMRKLRLRIQEKESKQGDQ